MHTYMYIYIYIYIYYISQVSKDHLQSSYCVVAFLNMSDCTLTSLIDIEMILLMNAVDVSSLFYYSWQE